MPSPLASLHLTDEQRLTREQEIARELTNAYDRINELEAALRGMIGLIKLLSHNGEIPQEVREGMMNNHRYDDAVEVLS